MSYKEGVVIIYASPGKSCNKGQEPSHIYSVVKDPFRPKCVFRTDRQKDARSYQGIGKVGAGRHE